MSQEQPPENSPVGEKLQKVLARAGFGSRREMEEKIAAGRVSVNGKTAKLGDRVTAKDVIRYAGRTVSDKRLRSNKVRILAYNKREGEVCTRRDPEKRKTVFKNLPELKDQRWISVGRLDINSSGLLLFTNDGEVANRLMHPSAELEREYAVRVLGAVSDKGIERLLAGVELEDGVYSFESVFDERGEGVNHWYNVTLKEGRNRQVRKLFETQHVIVNRLIRVRYGNVVLSNKLRSGQSRELSDQEIRSLLLCCKS